MPTICNICGAPISDDDSHCPYCDSPIEKHSETIETPKNELPYAPIQPVHNVDSTPVQIATTEEFGQAKFWSFVIISFLLPVVGWILYFIYEDKNIEAARTFSKFAWFGVAFCFIGSFLRHC